MQSSARFAFAVLCCNLIGCKPDYPTLFLNNYDLTRTDRGNNVTNVIMPLSGLYAFRLETELKPNSAIDPDSFDFEFEYEIQSTETTVRSTKIVDPTSIWWGQTSHGLIIDWLSVPDEVPIDTELTISYRFVADSGFVSQFGSKLGVSLRKLSDK